MQITPSHREFADAHKRRMDSLWPANVPVPKMKPKPARRPTVLAPKPLSSREWFKSAWKMLENPHDRGSIRAIQDLVCGHFGVPFLYMESTRRAAEYYLPRVVAIYLSQQFTSQSHTAIARAFKRDPSTIGSSVRSAQNFIALNHPIARDIEILSAKLRGEA